MESTTIQTPNKKDKVLEQQKEGGKKEASLASTSKPKARQPLQSGRNNKKKNWRKHIPPVTGCHGQCLQHGENLDFIQIQRGAKNEKTTFPKEIGLFPDFVNTLTQS
ncbi:hypothetical protein O181_043190 [Austropuccinia psidii MF-1]|uniref:Uncharacterized protein n=1 Tax=Austropuccinia psidii MF-1 TaxID=1389203 RepID=A0A9Q3DHZ1_9BASI|nr:hypothetical protein [Austropuccinia psidii MF-1]